MPGRHIGKALTRAMTDEQKGRLAALKGAWLAMREKRRPAAFASPKEHADNLQLQQGSTIE
jgi:hypothetical protein